MLDSEELTKTWFNSSASLFLKFNFIASTRNDVEDKHSQPNVVLLKLKKFKNIRK